MLVEETLVIPEIFHLYKFYKSIAGLIISYQFDKHSYEKSKIPQRTIVNSGTAWSWLEHHSDKNMGVWWSLTAVSTFKCGPWSVAKPLAQASLLLILLSGHK